MSGAVYVGTILIVGGALMERASRHYPDAEEDGPARDASLLPSLAAKRSFTRTSRLLQALGAVLAIIGILALLL